MGLPSKLTLVTVTSRDFLPGTRVMLDSFGASNPWFDGAVIVVHNDLSEEEQASLHVDFPGLEFLVPPAPLLHAIDQLASAQPYLAKRAARFFSLSAFWIEAKGDILFCDGDILFTGDIAPIFDLTGSLRAAPDRTSLEGRTRDPLTMEEVSQEGARAKGQSFNAGLMVLGEDLRQADHREAIMRALLPEWWNSMRSDHTDQAVLFRLFGDRVTLFEPSFNWLVGHGPRLRGLARVVLDDAKVLHFNGPAKPWRLNRHPNAASEDATFIKAQEKWFKAHTRYLTRRHFASIGDRSA